MKSFTDIFITRPVLATVVSLAILVLGLRAFTDMPIQQFPHIETSEIDVMTTYYGADADVIAGFITTPLENAIASASGIDYMTSSSSSGSSLIIINLRLNYDPNKALAEIQAKVASVINKLPPQAQQPVLTIGSSFGGNYEMYIPFQSEVLAENQITDYLVRVVQPKLQTIPGVQKADLLGPKNFAIRAWLDPDKLAAFRLTASDVSAALARNNYISGIGNTKGMMVQTSLTASTNISTVAEFEALVIRSEGDAIVRLGDVAKVTLGSDDYDSAFRFDGKDAITIGILSAPGANSLEVAKAVRAMFPSIQKALPAGLTGEIVYDATGFIDESLKEVIRTLVEAMIIVTVVVFAFMGSMRSVIIPTIAMPLSLVGTLAIMAALGFTINLLTLLAIVLAIGLVVDDAIIVVENVNRHLEEGMAPIPAAMTAARELGGPIIAMTVVLMAVYVPVTFQGGLTGTLFTEFALTLVGAVTISAVVALTLSPMMCSRMLKPHDNTAKDWENRLVCYIDHKFENLRAGYMRILDSALKTIPVVVVFALIVLTSIYFLYNAANRELAPNEDQGFLGTFSTSATNATRDQRLLFATEIRKFAETIPEVEHTFQIISPGASVNGFVLKTWGQRSRSAMELQPSTQEGVGKIAGYESGVFMPPPLPSVFGFPIQFAIGTTQPFSQLNQVAEAFRQEAAKSGMFIFLNSDLKFTKPQATVEIDRDKVAQLGVSISDVGTALSSMLGGGYVNYFNLDGRSYRVIPQVEQKSRLNIDQLLDYHVPTANGGTTPLSTIAKITTKAVPETLNHFQQLNSATIQGVPMPGVAMGDTVKYLQDLAARTLPQGYFVDYGGTTRQYITESSGFLITFGFALIVIYLALAALFESFRDPIIILVSVPMSIAGALIFISFGINGASINIYTQVGLVTLMGVISKHGILIVEFANKLQEQGKSKQDAIEEAASIRLRPILMTTAAMVFGVVPLLIASGAGASARFALGLVIASGISIGTLFTLFVVPAAYVVLAADHRTKKPTPVVAEAEAI